MSGQAAAIARLSEELVATAGGYLANTVDIPGTTCSVCRTCVQAPYPRCYSCNQHARSPYPTATRLGFVTYAASHTQSGYVMRRYKQNSAEHHTVFQLLTVLSIARHWTCVEAIARSPVTHWATVPSLPAKPGQHALNAIVHGYIRGSRVEVPLTAAVQAAAPRSFDPTHFSSAPVMPGAHVLLVDDTWTTGGHLQSAAYALLDAGAAEVSALIIARWLDPTYQNTSAFIKAELGRDFDPAICPWTGSACPP